MKLGPDSHWGHHLPAPPPPIAKHTEKDVGKLMGGGLAGNKVVIIHTCLISLDGPEQVK